MTGQWRDAFETQRRFTRPAEPPASPSPDDTRESDPLAIDLTDYRAWTLQRGRSRPTLMLHLRRHEPKSGMWTGWALSYPSLVAAEYVGERMVSLDFGLRQFMIQGEGLGELVAQLQIGSVVSVQEYSAAVWPTRPTGALISSIRRLGAAEEPPRQ